MKSLFTALLLFFIAVMLSGQHTFSVVAVDTLTGEVGSAGASCIGGAQIISDIIPGLGAIHTQSYWDATNQARARNRLLAGDTPQEVMNHMSMSINDASLNPSIRQYGVVAFNGMGGSSAAAYTGVNCFDYKNHIVGVNYAIQGNILLGQQILDSMEVRFNREQGSLADKLMACLQGANVAGADVRCLNSGISSLSAFIKVAKMDDQPGDFYLDIVVPNTPTGEDPIDLVQAQFDLWDQTTQTKELQDIPAVLALPNPAKDHFYLELLDETYLGSKLVLFDNHGRSLYERPITSAFTRISLHNIQKGIVYFLLIHEERNLRYTGKVILTK